MKSEFRGFGPAIEASREWERGRAAVYEKERAGLMESIRAAEEVGFSDVGKQIELIELAERFGDEAEANRLRDELKAPAAGCPSDDHEFVEEADAENGSSELSCRRCGWSQKLWWS